MTKAYLILLLLILIDLSTMGQVKNSKLMEGKVKYQYNDKEPSESYVPKVKPGKKYK